MAEQKFRLQSGIVFPDGTEQTTAYTGGGGGAPLFVIVNESGETAYSSNGNTWTQAAQFQIEGNSLNLDRVVLANNYVIYINGDNNLYYATEPGVTPTEVDISNFVPGNYNWDDIQTDGTTVVAVGSYNDGESSSVPVFAYTTNGSTWTLGNTDAGYLAAMSGSRFTSVDYNGTGWLIVAGGDGDNAGAFYTTNVSALLNEAQFVDFSNLGLDNIGDYDHVVWTGSNWFLRNVAGEGGSDQKLYVSSGSNPLTSTWTEIDLTALRDSFDFDLIDAGFYEMAGGNNKFMIASSEGQIIFTEDAGDSWTSNVPSPYTGSIDALISGTTTIITAITQIVAGSDWEPGSSLADREKIVIADAQPSTYNGTYYLEKFGVPSALVTAVANTNNSNWVPGTYTGINIEDFTISVEVGLSYNIASINVTATGSLKFGIEDVFAVPGSALGGTTGVDDLLLKVNGFASGIEYHLYTDKALTIELDSSEFDPFVSATFTLKRGTYIDAVGFGLDKFLIGNDDEQIFTSTDLLVWTKVDDQENDFNYWNDISFNATWGASSGIDTGDFTFNTTTMIMPSGGTITEGIVTSNPTIQLTPANPDVASQKLVIKGGGLYQVEENNISLNWNIINPQVSDSVDIYVYSPTYATQTLYWWIHPAEAGISDPGTGTISIDEFGSGTGTINFTVDSDDYEFTVRVSPEDNNYDPATIGVETLVFNSSAPAYGDHHLHLTTGDLAETSIILGTDVHNVRTTTDGGVEINTYLYPSGGGSGKWIFDAGGILTVPNDGIIQGLGNDGKLRSQLRLDPGSDITRLSGFSSQSDQYFDTNNWATGTYTDNAGTGVIEFTGASDIADWLSNNGYADRFFYSVNDGPQLASNGWGGGSETITFYTLTPPESSPTTVTSFRIYYQFESMLDIDTDDDEFLVRATTIDLRIETRQNGNINIESVNSLNLVGNGSVSLRNIANDGNITIQTVDGNYTWNFDETGTTTLPGAVVKSTVAITGVDLTSNNVKFEVTQVDGLTGAVTELTVTNSPNPAWVSNTGGNALGDVNFSITFDGSGNASVVIISGGTGHTVGQTFNLNPEAVGATEPTPTAIDLTKSINSVGDGTYTLADGVEGQVMYLVPNISTITLISNVSIIVAHARVEADQYTDVTLNPFYYYVGEEQVFTSICTLIYTQDHWQQIGGSWNVGP